jgi:hypothetical protein
MPRGVPITPDKEARIISRLLKTPHASWVTAKEEVSFAKVWRLAERECIELSAGRAAKGYKRLPAERHDAVVAALRENPDATQIEIAKLHWRQPLDRQPGQERSVPRCAAAGGITPVSGTGRPQRHGMAYFIRRKTDDCAVSQLHPDDREEAFPREGGVIASGLSIGDAEDLCVSKIDALRVTALASPAVATPAPPRRRGEHGARQLTFLIRKIQLG